MEKDKQIEYIKYLKEKIAKTKNKDELEEMLMRIEAEEFYKEETDDFSTVLADLRNMIYEKLEQEKMRANELKNMTEGKTTSEPMEINGEKLFKESLEKKGIIITKNLLNLKEPIKVPKTVFKTGTKELEEITDPDEYAMRANEQRDFMEKQMQHDAMRANEQRDFMEKQMQQDAMRAAEPIKNTYEPKPIKNTTEPEEIKKHR